jgi:hypothetical protein
VLEARFQPYRKSPLPLFRNHYLTHCIQARPPAPIHIAHPHKYTHIHMQVHLRAFDKGHGVGRSGGLLLVT